MPSRAHFDVNEDAEDRSAADRPASTPPPRLLVIQPSSETQQGHDERNGFKKEGTPSTSTSEERTSNRTQPDHSKPRWTTYKPFSLPWIQPHLTNIQDWKIVFRCSVAAWCGLLLMLIDTSRSALGNATFLLLIVSFISPPNESTSLVISRQLFMISLLAAVYGYCCFVIRIAHLARPEHLTQAAFTARESQRLASAGVPVASIPNALQEEIFSGNFLDIRSSAVFILFISVGAGFMLWLRGNLGPGPAVFSIIFSCILMAIVGTVAPLFPYDYYGIGTTFIYPLLSQLAINLVCTFIIFPQTSQSHFLQRMASALRPIRTMVAKQEAMLATDPTNKKWLGYSSMRTDLASSSGIVGVLGASSQILTRELALRQANGKDVKRLFRELRIILARSTGLIRFHTLISENIVREDGDASAPEKLIVRMNTVSPSRRSSTDEVNTPDTARSPSRSHPQTLAELPEGIEMTTAKLQDSPDRSGHGTPEKKHNGVHHHGVLGHLSHLSLSPSRSRVSSHHSLSHLLHEALHPHSPAVKPVGLYESQRYAHLEATLHNPDDENAIRQLLSLLHDASHDILASTTGALDHAIAAFERIERYNVFRRAMGVKYDFAALVAEHVAVRKGLQAAIHAYETDRRLEVIKPFAHLFVPSMHEEGEERITKPTQRGLFWTSTYMHALLQIARASDEMLAEIERIDRERQGLRLWFPRFAGIRHLRDMRPRGGEEVGHVADEDPNVIVGLKETDEVVRDPDHLPARGTLGLLGRWMHTVFHRLNKPDVAFGIKAAFLSALLLLPAHFRSSALFYYRERGLWALIMAQLTLTQYIGDTQFSFVSRIAGTFIGAVIGLAMWYIANGSGTDSAYGMAAVFAVVLPFLMAARLWYHTPVQIILTLVTTALVTGYSWTNAHTSLPVHGTWGWELSWRRFVAVVIGVTAAFVWSWVPPRGSSQKVVIRSVYAKTLTETGKLFCDVLSYASLPEGKRLRRPQHLVDNVIAVRTKLRATTARKPFIRYEWSLRGSWPEASYDLILQHQLEIVDLLAQLIGVLQVLPTPWVRAYLDRTRLNDPRFLGEITATFQLLSTALRTGQPLPAYRTPLLESAWTEHPFNADVPPKLPLSRSATREGDHEYKELPEHVDLETLCDSNYQRWAVGVSSTYSLLNRLDRLVAVTKELVGERYTVANLGSSPSTEHLLHRVGSEESMA